MKQKIKALLFDLDGLILDTERLAKHAWQEGIQFFGATMSDELFLSLIGLKTEDSSKLLAKALGEAFPLEECREKVRELIHLEVEENGIPVKDGFFELLEFIEESPLKFAVATSSNRERALFKLGINDLASRMPHLVTGDEVKNGKPAPDIFLAAAKKLSVPPEYCMVLEDSFVGLRAAFAANMLPVMIPDLLPADESIRTILYEKLDSLHQVESLLSPLIEMPL